MGEVGHMDSLLDAIFRELRCPRTSTVLLRPVFRWGMYYVAWILPVCCLLPIPFL